MLDEETHVKRADPNMHLETEHLDCGMTSLKAPVMLGTKPELVESG